MKRTAHSSSGHSSPHHDAALKDEVASTQGKRPLNLPNFRTLWSGYIFVALAVQVYTVALVWLVLETTGSGVALGAVLISAAIPRALMLLFSGALIDRVSPRRMLLLATGFGALTVAVVATLMLFNSLALWHIFLLAGLLGLADACFYPSALTFTARLLGKEQLASGTALIQGVEGLANVVGPALSGFSVGRFGLSSTLFLNASLYLLGGMFIARIRTPPKEAEDEPSESTSNTQSLGRAVLEGISYAWREPVIRTSLLVITMLNFAVLGPAVVGGAVLAERRLGGDATAFGLLFSAFGTGMLAGTVLMGLDRWHIHPRHVLAGGCLLIGGCLVGLGFAGDLLVAFPLYLLIGVAAGMMNVRGTTWLLSRADETMQGRITSLLMFASIATDPFSSGLSGILADANLTRLFVAAGGLMAFTACLIFVNRKLREAVY